MQSNPTSYDTNAPYHAEVMRLVADGQMVSAIKLACDSTGLDLKEAKNLLDILQSSTYDGTATRTTNRESIRAQRNGSRITVTYKGNDGIAQEVNPAHPLWSHVKSRIRDNELIAEYERQYAAGEVDAQSASVFVDEKNNTKRNLFIAVVVAIAAYILYTIATRVIATA